MTANLRERLLGNWKEDDPGFDAPALWARVEALAAPARSAMLAQAALLGDRDITNADGSTHPDLEWILGGKEEVTTWFSAHLDTAWPLLALSLRHDDGSVQAQSEGILVGRAEAREALLSVVEHPGPNKMHERPQHMPHWALIQLGAPAPAVRARLIALLRHPDFRCVQSAGAVLAHFANDDACLEPLLDAYRRPTLDSAIIIAAEHRPDPVLRPILEHIAEQEASQRTRIKEVLATFRDAGGRNPGTRKSATKPPRR